jgi:hypothetical protein
MSTILEGAIVMTETQYLIWFIGQAVVTIAILVVGTLGAADLLPRPR